MNLTKSKLHIAVLAALPLIVMTSVNANAGECGLVAGEITCVAGDTFFISNVDDPNGSRHPTTRATSADEIDGETVTINGDTTITGSLYNVHSTGLDQGKVGIFILNGEDEATTPLTLGTSGSPANGQLPINLMAGTYVNEGVTVINNGTILLENANATYTSGENDRNDLNNAGIYMDGSNNTIINNGTITVKGDNNVVTRWGVLMTGDDANNLNPTVENYGTIEVLTGYDGVVDKIQGAVVLKESIINGVINNYEDAVIRAGVDGSPTTATNRYLYGVYADDNAQTVTVNNWGRIQVDAATNVIHSDGTYNATGTLSNATANAAIYLRSFDAIINNYAGATITGDIKTLDSTHDLVLTNAGLIDGYVVRQVRKDNTSGYNTHNKAGVIETGYTTYKPVIKQSGGNPGTLTATEYAAIAGYITGDFNIVAYRGSNADPAHNLNIQPIIDGTTVHVDDTYRLTGGNLVLDSTNLAIATPQIINTPLVTWELTATSGSPLSIQVESINSAASLSGVTQQSARAVDAVMTSSDSDITSALQAISTVDGVEQAGQQLRAEANNASYQAVVAAANHVASVIGFHQDQVRAGATGVSSGEAADGAGFWLEAFGFRGDQKERSNVDGYQADTGGFVLGGDKAVGNGDARVGAAFAYGSTGISGKGATTANRTDIDSYQGIFYGSYNAGAWYADASLGYGRQQYDTKRVVSLVGANLTGSHNANQYSAKLGFGLPFSSGVTTITPLASLAYVKLDQNGYTESDRNDTGAALSVDSTKTESLRSGLGAKLSVALATGELSPTLEARAVWNHEFADTHQNITASFDGGDSFTTNGVSQSRDSANLGVGVNLKSKNGQTLSVNYDAEVKNDYVSHTAALKARFDF